MQAKIGQNRSIFPMRRKRARINRIKRYNRPSPLGSCPVRARTRQPRRQAAAWWGRAGRRVPLAAVCHQLL